MTDIKFENMKAQVAGAMKSQLSDIQMLSEPQRGYATKHFVETVARCLHKSGYQPKGSL